jgi:8-oxo-dGTP pyrophosphatase MutT (NUDIX family)
MSPPTDVEEPIVPTSYCWHCYHEIPLAADTCPVCRHPSQPPPGTGYTDRLVWALQHPLPDRRLVAATALGERGDRRAVAPLRGLLADPDPYVAAATLTSVVRLAGVAASRELLTRLATSGAAPVRAAARCALDSAPGPGEHGAVVPLSDDLPVVARNAVRCVVRDGEGHVLLLRGAEAWELPGGGIEPGENVAEAAVRELAEETGLRCDPSQVGDQTWTRQASFRAADVHRLQHETIVRIDLDTASPPVHPAGRHARTDGTEGYRWWPVDEIVTGTARFYPGRLSDYLTVFLNGHEISEPFEAWS